MIANLIKVLTALTLGFVLSACSSAPMTIQELAAQEREDDANLWDEEDYKSIAAKSCILYKEVSDRSLGDLYADWTALMVEYTKVRMTSGALDDHPKWGPIAELTFKLQVNAANRGVGGGGVEVPSNLALETYELCNELGLDLNE